VFDGHGFQPYKLLQYFIVELKGKTISIDIEVVDAPLDYNLFLGHSWFYAMTFIASSVFHLLQFPHQGKIVTIDQLDYCMPDINNHSTNNIPFLGHSNIEYKSVGVGLLKDSSLMGFFPLPPPDPPHQVSMLNMITLQVQQSYESFDPWVVSSPSEIETLGDIMSLSPAESHLPQDLVPKPSLPLPISVDPLSSSLSW
jgi:hypothetical protein